MLSRLGWALEVIRGVNTTLLGIRDAQGMQMLKYILDVHCNG